MSDESYEQYVERRRADKTTERKQRKHLWLVVIFGLGFYAFTNWISRDMDRAAQAQSDRKAGHRSGANPWAVEKPAHPSAQ